MNTRTALLLVLLFAGVSAAAQERSDRFDPVTYVGTLSLFRQWTDNAFLVPPHAVRSFRDTIHANGAVVAFTVTHTDSLPGGWTLHMDFDPDRFGAIRLVRIHGRKIAAEGGADEFVRLDAWIQALLGKRIMDRQEAADAVTWRWMARPEYALSIRRQPGDAAAVLTLRLEATAQLPQGAERGLQESGPR